MKTYKDIPTDGGSDIIGQVTEQAGRVKTRLASVRHVVAVMSGKGGVGKSSMTVNLAAALAREGQAVGILDADINGPSIAKMTGVRSHTPQPGADGMTPATGALGIKVMSIDLFLPQDATPVLWDAPTQHDAYTWRGMMEIAALREFLSDTAWGTLDVLLVPDLSTFYRDRERTLPALVRLIDDVREATPGNILVAFPSFAYARAAAAVFDHPELRCQEPEMTLADREDFIAWLNTDGGRVAFVVMGGVFAESVDYDSDAVHGIVVVGVGLPPRSLRRDCIAADSVSNDIAEDGYEIAYRQPAMTRVVQAVGRVARGDSRGIAVLVDPRFGDPAYRAFMPSWWQPRFVRASAAAKGVADFWDC